MQTLLAVLGCAALLPAMVQAQTIPSGRVVSGTLSFDGHASAGDFTGSTTTVTGQLSGAPEWARVRGWVEAPVQTLKTGNNRRDRDLNKSMESSKYPDLRFDLSGVNRLGGTADSAAVILHGGLTLHGVTRTVDLPATIRFKGPEARLRADFPLNLKDYRIGGLSKLLGMLKMYDKIEVHANLVFRLTPNG